MERLFLILVKLDDSLLDLRFIADDRLHILLETRLFLLNIVNHSHDLRVNFVLLLLEVFFQRLSPGLCVVHVHALEVINRSGASKELRVICDELVFLFKRLDMTSSTFLFFVEPLDLVAELLLFQTTLGDG